MKLCLVVIVVLLFQGSVMAQNASLSSLNWLLGSWEQNSPTITVVESWEYSSDSTALIGKGITRKNGEVITQEVLSISIIDDIVCYNVKVENHNNNETITFRKTEATDNSILFENPDHDFPQKIFYKQITNNQIEAEVSAIINSKEKKIRFLYNRKQHE